MSASLTLVILMSIMYAAGIYVMLERSLTRFLIGFVLVGNATNLLILIVSGASGSSPIVTETAADADMVDPIPQVLMLTAIVINFGITAFILALIYRTWWLAQLGDEGDNLNDEHEHETEESTEEAFRQVDVDDEAIQRLLDESDEHSPGLDELLTGSSTDSPAQDAGPNGGGE